MPPHWKVLEWRVWKSTEQLQNPSQRCSLATYGGSRTPGGNDQLEHLLEAAQPEFWHPHPGSRQCKELDCIQRSSFLVQAGQLFSGSLGHSSCLIPWEKPPSSEIRHVGSQQYPRLGGVSCGPQVSGTKFSSLQREASFRLDVLESS